MILRAAETSPEPGSPGAGRPPARGDRFAGALRLLLDPGAPWWWTTLVRIALAALFVPAGLGKFVNHDAYVERFERWGFGAAAGETALLVGTVEVVCGLLLLTGLWARPAALALIATMVGALATAGRVDGGRDVWLPLVAIAGLAVVAAWGAGRWAFPRLGRRPASRR